jgi:hypothetical protein
LFLQPNKEGQFPPDVKIKLSKYIPYLTIWNVDLDTTLTGIAYDTHTLLRFCLLPFSDQNLAFIFTTAERITQEILSYATNALSDTGVLIAIDFQTKQSLVQKEFPFQRAIPILHYVAELDMAVPGTIYVVSKNEVNISQTVLKDIQSDQSIADPDSIISNKFPISLAYYKTVLLGLLPGINLQHNLYVFLDCKIFGLLDTNDCRGEAQRMLLEYQIATINLIDENENSEDVSKLVGTHMWLAGFLSKVLIHC